VKKLNPIPVYLFLGFLESGKTRFIQETLEDERFNTGEKTLLIQCEEGIEEYNPDLFASSAVHIVTVEDKSDLNAEFLEAAAKKIRAERVMIEYNGMWELADLGNALPKSWRVYQVLMCADASTFPNYLQNVRQLTADKLRNAEDVIFNRVDENTDRALLHRSVRMLNRRAQMIFEYTNGDIADDDIVDELPFDTDADIIEIGDEDYGLWYLDAADNMEKYDGKTVRFRAMACHSKKVPSNCFVPGRFGMTCCVEDITFVGYICDCGKFTVPPHKSWIMLTAKVSIKDSKVYDGPGPWLDIVDIAYDVDPPADEVVYFT
jgi:G3E family GTPase